ncbi:hypothetical protein [Paenibacillus sp. CMAA1364]
MQEFVGYCNECGNSSFCLDGFLNGIVLEDKSLLCFDCSDQDISAEMDGGA